MPRNSTSSSTPPPPQWVIDLQSPPKPKTKANIPDPPGYSASTSGKARSPFPHVQTNHANPSSSAIRSGQSTSTKSAYSRGDGHAEDQEILGTGPRARQGPAYECNHDVYVWQFAADLQHYDGIHAV